MSAKAPSKYTGLRPQPSASPRKSKEVSQGGVENKTGLDVDWSLQRNISI